MEITSPKLALVSHEIDDGSIIPFDEDLRGLVLREMFGSEQDGVGSPAGFCMGGISTWVEGYTEGVKWFKGTVYVSRPA